MSILGRHGHSAARMQEDDNTRERWNGAPTSQRSPALSSSLRSPALVSSCTLVLSHFRSSFLFVGRSPPLPFFSVVLPPHSRLVVLSHSRSSCRSVAFSQRSLISSSFSSSLSSHPRYPPESSLSSYPRFPGPPPLLASSHSRLLHSPPLPLLTLTLFSRLVVLSHCHSLALLLASF